MRFYFVVLTDALRGYTTQRITARDAQDLTEKKHMSENHPLVFVAELEKPPGKKEKMWFAYNERNSYSEDIVQEVELHAAPPMFLFEEGTTWLRV